MYTPVNIRRLGQENRTTRPESPSRPRDSATLPESSPRHPHHGSPRDSDDKDVIVLSDSEEEAPASNRTSYWKGPIDLTSDSDDPLNPYRLLNRPSQRLSSSALPRSVPSHRQAQSALERESAPSSRHSAMPSPQFTTSRSTAAPQTSLRQSTPTTQSVDPLAEVESRILARRSALLSWRQTRNDLPTGSVGARATATTTSIGGFQASTDGLGIGRYGQPFLRASMMPSKRSSLPATAHQKTAEGRYAETDLQHSPSSQNPAKQIYQNNVNQVPRQKDNQTSRGEIPQPPLDRAGVSSQTFAVASVSGDALQRAISQMLETTSKKTHSTSANVATSQTSLTRAKSAVQEAARQSRAETLSSHPGTTAPSEPRLSKIVKLALPRWATATQKSQGVANSSMVGSSTTDDQSIPSARSTAGVGDAFLSSRSRYMDNEHGQRVQELETSVSREIGRVQANTTQTHELPRAAFPRILAPLDSLPHSINGHVAEEESITSDLSSASEQVTTIGPELKTVKAVMQQLRQDLFAWREKTVQAELRQATIDMRQYPGPKIDSTLPDPFKALTDQRRSASGLLAPQGGNGNEGAPFAKPHSKKALVLRTAETSFWTGGTLLPKYKAIGRVSSSFLAPNFRTAKYRPYDAEDEVQDPDATEKYAELEQRFNNNHDSLLAQRDCQELIWLWQPWAQELYSSLGISADDVLYFFTHALWDPREIRCAWSAESSKAWTEEESRRCGTCELADTQTKWTYWRIHRDMLESMPKPDDHKLALAGLAAYAFHEMTGISLWHVAVGGILKPLYEEPPSVDTKGLSLCVICFRHQCPDHGSFEEPADDDHRDPEDFKAFVNDEERDHNLRKFMCLPVRKPKQEDSHVCGLFCVDTSQTLRQILGRQADGSISGDFRTTTGGRHVLADDELCGESCFWEAVNRRDLKISDMQFQPFASPSEKTLVDKVLQFYLNNKRGPCLIARVVKDVSCMKIFEHMVWHICHVPHPIMDVEPMSDSSTAQRQHNHMHKKKKPKVIPNIDVSRSAELDQRPPFVPCSHDGPCYNNPACTCFKSRVHCERFCGCDESCKRRFRGCTCTTRGNKICFKDSRCECWKHNRECDPYLCGRCGVYEVLDSSNKYRDDIRKGLCRNNRIQLGLPAPTTKAPSQVQGYGLYSRADIASGDFIGEYTGEVISISEGDRRGAMYHVLNQEYLFVINRGQEIDASNNGNKMRFMNNSQRDEHINVEPKKLWCSGVVRVGLFAKRFIKAGEELLYNYNYPESVVKNFWEPGDKPANVRRLIPMGAERAARSTGANKLAGEKADAMREESSQSPLLTRHPKRKRAVEESPEGSPSPRKAAANEAETDSSVDELARPPEIDDSEDSDYETNGLATDEGGEVEDGEDDESELDPFEEPATMVRGAVSRRSLQGARNSGAKVPKSNATRSQEGKSHRPKHGGKSSRVANKNLDGASATTRRKRKIGPHDKRFGGRAQQLAWQTRRLNGTMGNTNTAGATVRSPRNK